MTPDPVRTCTRCGAPGTAAVLEPPPAAPTCVDGHSCALRCLEAVRQRQLTAHAALRDALGPRAGEARWSSPHRGRPCPRCTREDTLEHPPGSGSWACLRTGCFHAWDVPAPVDAPKPAT